MIGRRRRNGSKHTRLGQRDTEIKKKIRNPIYIYTQRHTKSHTCRYQIDNNNKTEPVIYTKRHVRKKLLIKIKI